MPRREFRWTPHAASLQCRPVLELPAIADVPVLPLAASGSAIGVGLTLVLTLGVAAQWLAWRLKVPSILLLLTFGFLAGPVAFWASTEVLGLSEPAFLNIDAIFAEEVLLALVGLAVGLILFEGGLTLTFGEIRGVRNAVLSLVTIGALVTWIISSLAARYVLDLPWGVAMVLGAILVVTGPTVIGPLLRFVRPTGSVGKVLKWEGIVIDPIGALLAVLVFEAVVAGGGMRSTATISTFLGNAALASVIGSTLGLLAAWVYVQMLKRFLIPDHLQVPLALGFAAASFTASNAVVSEAGLFATTIMGIALANQKKVKVGHVVEFKEVLVVLMIALLFIALSARLTFADLAEVNWLRFAGFIAVLVLIARPLAIFASTLGPLGGKVGLKDKIFLSWMAPRGIVAAAIASVFGLALTREGVAGAELLTPYVFLTIVTTVALYGLTAVWVARRLDIANPDNAGFLIAGAGPVARQIGKALQDEKVEVLLVDLNYSNIQQARLAGLPTIVANVLGPQVHERIELTGIGRLLAMTPNNEVNSLAAVQYGRHFGRSNVFQLSPHSPRTQAKARAKGDAVSKKTQVSEELSGRVAFAGGPTFDRLDDLFDAGAQVRRTRLSKEFTYDDWKTRHGIDDGRAIVLFIVDDTGSVRVTTPEAPVQPKAGQSIIALTSEGATVPANPPVAEEVAGQGQGSVDAARRSMAAPAGEEPETEDAGPSMADAMTRL